MYTQSYIDKTYLEENNLKHKFKIMNITKNKDITEYLENEDLDIAFFVENEVNAIAPNNVALTFYPPNPEDLTKIVRRSAGILDVEIEEKAATEIARRSRGTPRIANRLLKRVRDYAMVLGNGKIDLKIAKHALNKLEIDELGLDEIDRKLLESMIIQYGGRPVGIEALAVTIGEEVDTIEDVYEPYLIQIGFIARTLRGRMVLPPAYKHLGYDYKGE